MAKKFGKSELNYENLDPKKEDFYKSGRINVNHITEDTEIKASVPLQVRINGGEWVDIRQLDPDN